MGIKNFFNSLKSIISVKPHINNTVYDTDHYKESGHTEYINYDNTEAKPDDNYLAPAEILLLSYMDGMKIDRKLPNYFNMIYGLDTGRSYEKIKSKGYITYAPIEYALNREIMSELKNILKENDLKVSGKKAELVERICENVPRDALSKYENMYYKTTQEGQKILANNEHVKYFHEKYGDFGIDVNEADNYKNKHPEMSNYEILINILNNRLVERHSNPKLKDFHLVRSPYAKLAKAYSFEEKYILSLGCCFVVCYIDKILSTKDFVSMMCKETFGKDNEEFLPSVIKQQIESLPKEHIYAPWFISTISHTVREYGIDKDKLHGIYSDAINTFFDIDSRLNCERKFDLSPLRKYEDAVFEEVFTQITSIEDHSMVINAKNFPKG